MWRKVININIYYEKDHCYHLRIFLIVIASFFLLIDRFEVEEIPLSPQIEDGDNELIFPEEDISEVVICADEGFNPALVTVQEGKMV